MKNTLNIMTLAAIVIMATHASPGIASDDDHPLLGRYPGAKNTNHPRSTEFDVVDLPAGPMTNDGPEEILELEGRIRWDGFVGPSGASEIAVGRSYEAALTEGGFEMLFSCTGEECGDLTSFLTDQSFRDMGEPVRGVSAGWGWKHYVRHNDRVRFYLARRDDDESVAHALVYISRYAPRDTHMMIGQIIVESAPLNVENIEVSVLGAGELQKGMEEDGRVAVPGIFFEVDSAELRSESHDALEQMAILMRNAPSMHIHIVGHTDIEGSFEYNLNLSEQRAQAVYQALINSYDIQASRMVANGVAWMAPITSNSTEEGREQNRRVELVLVEM